MPVPEVILLVYLLLGFLGGLWNPSWVIFLLIPLYYWIAACFYKPDQRKNDAPDVQK